MNLERYFKASTVKGVLDHCAANPTDWLALTVLADAIRDLGEEHSEAVADGCLALALHELCARRSEPHGVSNYRWWAYRGLATAAPEPDDLFLDWYDKMPRPYAYTRQEAVVQAVTGFSLLPAARRAYYLTKASVIPNFHNVDKASRALVEAYAKTWAAP